MNVAAMCSVVPVNINWAWFACAVTVAYGIGGAWYSVVCSKEWMRVFKVDMPEKITKGAMARTFLLQFAVCNDRLDLEKILNS
jgi:hypothetical protein